MKTGKHLSRRQFMIHSAAATTAASLLSTHATAADKECVRLGFVGVGSRGTHLLRTALQLPGVSIPAVCDLNPEAIKSAQEIVEKSGGSKPEAYSGDERAWEKLCQRDDLDGVICATSWEWHTPVAVAAMKAKKYVGVEVPAALTIEECWELVKVSESTGMPCMMLENVCYFENVLTLLRMVREGVFGELLHAEAGYQHDCRKYMFNDQGLTWRGEASLKNDGNLYPTHPIGPIAQWFNINRGDRFTRIVSMSSKARGMQNYAAEKFGEDHPLAKQDYALGDVNTCLLETAQGRTVTLYFDMLTPRPYDLILRLQGTKGIHMGGKDGLIYLEDRSPQAHAYEPFAPYMKEFAHPLWTALEEQAKLNGGHGGSDYITLYDFVKAVRQKTAPPQDVYDAATWSAIVPLSIQSVASNSETLDFPDFSQGKWEKRPALPIYGA